MGLLGEIVRAVDPALARHAIDDPPSSDFEDRFEDRSRALVFEAVREAFQLHYGEPRTFAGMDRDLRLLGGDALYALAVEHLAERGDLDAIVELAELISLSARAVAESRRDRLDDLWEASLEALSSSSGPPHPPVAGADCAKRAGRRSAGDRERS